MPLRMRVSPAMDRVGERYTALQNIVIEVTNSTNDFWSYIKGRWGVKWLGASLEDAHKCKGSKTIAVRGISVFDKNTYDADHDIPVFACSNLHSAALPIQAGIASVVIRFAAAAAIHINTAIRRITKQAACMDC